MRIGLITLTAIALTLALPPFAQDVGYHAFADARTIFGMPNFWNLASNLPFLWVGASGLIMLARTGCAGPIAELKPAYAFLFVGVLLTAFGSIWYHLAPTNSSLVWDRLPMAIAFMAFFSAMLGQALGPRIGRIALVPLLTAGVLSVGYWHHTESIGAGDLRFYALVQFLPMVLLPVMLTLYRNRFATTRSYLWAALGSYAVSKLFEWLDTPLYHVTGWISGHTVKHLCAGLGAWLIYLALRRQCDRKLKIERTAL